MEPAFQDPRVRRLLDRAEIADVLGRYAYGMDARDWDMVRSCWAEKIAFDFTGLDLWDEPLESVDREVWMRTLQAFFAALPASQHLNTPVLYEFDGDDRCTVIAVLHAKHWRPNESGDPLQTVVGYYRDELIRTDDGWKICAMKEEVQFNEGNAFVLDASVASMLRTLREETA